MNLFSAKIILDQASLISLGKYSIIGEVIDNTGNFFATDASIGDIIYINDTTTNTLQRYSIIAIDGATDSTNLIATIQWDVAGQDPVDPAINGDSIIGRRNQVANTITLTSMSVNFVGEQLETDVKNFEQDMLIDTMALKEDGLNKPTQDGDVLSSTVSGIRSWIALPSISDAINAVKGQANGLAQLGADGKLVLNEIPSIAITDVFVVNNELEMLALGTTKDAEKGDLASRLDTGFQYILIGDASVLSDWHQLSQPVPVQSINSKTGIVVLTTSDIAEGINLYYTDERVAASPIISTINSAITALQENVGTVNGSLANYMPIATYDSNGNGKVDKSELSDNATIANYAVDAGTASIANSVEWTNVQNKPLIPTKTSDLIKDDVYEKIEIDNLLLTKANATDIATGLDAINTNLSEINSELVLKANDADVTSKLDTINSNLELKANATDVATSLDLKEDKIDADTKLALKADITSVDLELALKANVADIAIDLDLKEDKTDADAKLALKANIADVVTSLDLKEDKIDVDTKLALKADITSVDLELALKANITDVTSNLDLKEDKTDADAKLALKANITDMNADLELKEDKIDADTKLALKANITDINTSLALKDDITDVDNKLALKANAADVTTSLALKEDKTDADAKLALKANTTDVYTQAQVNTKVANIINDGSIASTSTFSSSYIEQLLNGALIRYASGDSTILATGAGVTVTKAGNAATVICPTGVKIVSLAVHFTSSDISSSTSCSVDFGANVDYNTGTGINSTDYSVFLPPLVQVINDVNSSRAVRATAAFNYNNNSHTMVASGLASNVAVWVRLVF